MFDINLENFTSKSNLIIVTAGAAMIHRRMWPCMYSIIYVYWFTNQLFVACYLLWLQIFGSSFDKNLSLQWWIPLKNSPIEVLRIVYWLLIELEQHFFSKESETINLQLETWHFTFNHKTSFTLIVKLSQLIPDLTCTDR